MDNLLIPFTVFSFQLMHKHALRKSFALCEFPTNHHVLIGLNVTTELITYMPKFYI